MLGSGLGTSWGVDPGDAAGLRMSGVVSVVSETAVDGVVGWVTTWLAPTTSTVGAELTLPTNTIGAIAGLGTVTGTAVELGMTSAETGEGFEVDSSTATRGAAGMVDTGNTGLPVLFPRHRETWRLINLIPIINIHHQSSVEFIITKGTSTTKWTIYLSCRNKLTGTTRKGAHFTYCTWRFEAYVIQSVRNKKAKKMLFQILKCADLLNFPLQHHRKHIFVTRTKLRNLT